jgi:hypothetical protein
MRANIRFKHAIPIPLKLPIGSRPAGMKRHPLLGAPVY